MNPRWLLQRNGKRMLQTEQDGEWILVPTVEEPCELDAVLKEISMALAFPGDGTVRYSALKTARKFIEKLSYIEKA